MPALFKIRTGVATVDSVFGRNVLFSREKTDTSPPPPDATTSSLPFLVACHVVLEGGQKDHDGAIDWRFIDETESSSLDSSASANNLSTLELHHTFDFFSTPQLTLPLTGAPYYVRFSVLSDHKSTIAQFIEDEEEEKGESLAARTTRRSVGLESDDESDDESVASDMSDYHLHDAIVRLVGQFIGPSRVPLGTYIISAMDLMAATEMNEPVMLLDTNISTSTSLSITPLPFTARDCHDESVPMPTTMTKQYYIESSATSMVENLAESAFTNDVPRQMLEIFIGRVTRRHLQATLDLETFDAYYNQAQRCKRTGFYATLLNSNGRYCPKPIDVLHRQEEIIRVSDRSVMVCVK